MTDEHEEAQEIAVIEAAEHGISPQRQIEQMSELVQAIASKCTGPKFISNIQGKQYPKVEWWTTVGATQGLSASEVYSKRVTCVEHDGAHWGYEAKAEVHDNTGKLRSSASMVCMSCEVRSQRTKTTWGEAGEYAVKSMAYTRSVSKSYRVNLSYLAVMANLQPTAAEEVPDGGFGDAPQDEGLGVCPEHGVAYRQSDKQRDLGYPPSHKQGDGWCTKKDAPPDIPSGGFTPPETRKPKREKSHWEVEATELLSQRFGGESARTHSYVIEVIGRDVSPTELTEREWETLYSKLAEDALDVKQVGMDGELHDPLPSEDPGDFIIDGDVEQGKLA